MPGLHDLCHFLEEKCHQQCRDMRAVDICVGHDDDAFVAQIIRVAVLARTATQRQLQVGDFIVRADFVGGGRGDV